MSKFTKSSDASTDGLRVECPCSSSCSYAIPESEWDFQEVTDHFCPNGHCFRIEGTSAETLVFYEIDPRLTTKKSLI